MYGEDGIGEVKATRGKQQEYLGMKLIYTSEGELKIDMQDYIQETLKEFPEELNGNISTSWNDKLFKVDDEDSQLNEKCQKQFHSHVMRCMFLCKRGRPDIAPGISFLTTRVKKPCQGDWRKLKKI